METPARTDPEARWVQLAGGPAAYTDEGEGPVVLCVPGYPGGPRDYRYLAPQLVGRRVLRLAMPGQGLTPLETAPGPSIAARADFVCACLQALELEEAILVGHSMGGAIVSAAAADNERVRAVALLASIGHRAHVGFRRLPSWIPALAERDWTWALIRPAVRRGFQAVGFPSYYDDKSLRHTLRCAGALDFDEVSRAHRALRIPTLVAWAVDDPLVEPALAEAVAESVPNGPRLSWPEGGHNIQKSHAEELAQAILRL